MFADNIKVNNDKEESSTSEDENQKTEKTEHNKRERTDSIDMPMFDANSRDNHDNNDKVSDKNENVNSKEASEDVTEPTESTNETKPISDDLAISDSDESNSKSRAVSDNDDSKDSKSVQDITKSKEIEVEDPDDYLLYLEDILKTVHKAYYDLYDQMVSRQTNSTNSVPANSAGPDLKTVFSIQISSMFKTYKLQVIPYVKRKALTGVHMVFSGVVPTQIPMERSKPFLLARSLGATVSNKVV